MALILTLASRNEGKRRELCRWIETHELPVEIALNDSVEDIEETGADFIENARIKAQATPPVAGSQWVLGEDSGMIVDALDGSFGVSPFPGIYSNRWLTLEIRDALLGKAFPNVMPLEHMMKSGVSNQDLCRAVLKLMENQTNRKGRYCCGMALWNPAENRSFEILECTELEVITGEPRGMQGFGYDPIMQPVDEPGLVNQTMAELSPDEKNRISHRGKAFKKVLQYLQAHAGF